MFTVGRKHDQTRLSIDLANSTRITSVGVAAIRELINDLEPDVVFASSKETSQLDSHLQYLGSAALIVTNGGRSVNISKGATTIEVPVATVSTRRATTGAGDAFIAVSLCQLLANASVVTAVEAGVQAATELVAQTNLFGIGGS